MRDYYRILDPPLGTGAFAEVRPCIYKKDLQDKRSSIKEFRAVKILRRSYMKERDYWNFRNEVAILSLINDPKYPNHPNIIKMHEFYEDPKRFMLVTELCQGGELLAFIN
jgi:serine/threonine protein kinase